MLGCFLAGEQAGRPRAGGTGPADLEALGDAGETTKLGRTRAPASRGRGTPWEGSRTRWRSRSSLSPVRALAP